MTKGGDPRWHWELGDDGGAADPRGQWGGHDTGTRRAPGCEVPGEGGADGPVWGSRQVLRSRDCPVMQPSPRRASTGPVPGPLVGPAGSPFHGWTAVQRGGGLDTGRRWRVVTLCPDVPGRELLAG